MMIHCWQLCLNNIAESAVYLSLQVKASSSYLFLGGPLSDDEDEDDEDFFDAVAEHNSTEEFKVCLPPQGHK